MGSPTKSATGRRDFLRCCKGTRRSLGVGTEVLHSLLLNGEPSDA